MIKYEYRKTLVRQGPPILLSKEELIGLTGFRSQFGFDEDAQAHIAVCQNMVALDGFSVYSDTLLVDFDDCPLKADEFERKINYYSYVKFHSGGRSIHFHIRINPIHSQFAPISCRKWIEKNAPGADLTVYRTSSIFRLAGTEHASHPGKFKLPLHINEGELLDIPLLTNSSFREYADRIPDKSSDEAKQVANYTLMNGLQEKIASGTVGRHNHVIKILFAARTLDIPAEDIARKLIEWNSKFCNPPLPVEKILRNLKDIYTRRI